MNKAKEELKKEVDNIQNEEIVDKILIFLMSIKAQEKVGSMRQEAKTGYGRGQ